jgi:enamine deaminase RidA (YjgF/YER057c/UK114 family)
MIGAQVVIESISADKKVLNPRGLAFFSAVPTKDAPGAIEKLARSVAGSGVKAADVLRVTCFLSSFEQLAALRSSLSAAFPSAMQNLVQMQRLGVEPQAACEGVGRIDSATPAASSADIALISSPKVVITETQLAFRDQPSDFRIAFQRLAKILGTQGVTPKDVFWLGIYSLTRPNAAHIEELRWEFLDRAHPAAGTSLLFEGLPSTDATAAIEMMAARN